MIPVRNPQRAVFGRVGIAWCVVGILAAWLIGSIVAAKTAPNRFIESPATKLAYAAKSGRVVDATTGSGISDATVVATGYYRLEVSRGSLINLVVYTLAPVEGRSGENELYATTAVTDEQGGYSIGDMRDQSWANVKNTPAFPAYHLTSNWSVRALKLGYVPSEPEDRTTNVTQNDGVTVPIRIDDLLLKPAASGLEGLQIEARVYVQLLSKLGDRGGIGPRQVSMKSSQTAAFFQKIYPYLLAKLCALRAEELVPSSLVFEVLVFSPNEAEVVKRLNPDLWWIRFGQIQSRETVGQSAEHLAAIERRGNTKIENYAAGSVCSSMQTSGKTID